MSPGIRNFGEEKRRDWKYCKAIWVITSQINKNRAGHVTIEKYQAKKRNSPHYRIFEA